MYEQKEIRNVSYINYDLFEVKWYVTTWCNYKCWYCIQNVDGELDKDRRLWDKKYWVKEEDVIESAKRINLYIKNHHITKRIGLQILGGEVSFYDWTKILSYIDNVGKVFITTNFSNKLGYYQNLYDYCYGKKIRLQLLCSYHEVGDSFFEKYIELCKWCLEKNYKTPGVTFVVNNDFDFSFIDRFPEMKNVRMDFCLMQMHDGTITTLSDEVKQKINYINSLPHPWSDNTGSIKVRPGRWAFQINSDIISCSQNALFRELKEGCLYIKDAYCDAGINSMCVLGDGSLCKCPNSMDQIFGNIFNDDDLKLKLSSSKCMDRGCMLCQPVNIVKKSQSSEDPFIDRSTDE